MRKSIALVFLSCALVLPTQAVADVLSLDDFSVGQFSVSTNDTPEGWGLDWSTGLPTQHVLSGERKAAVTRSSPLATGVATMTVANSVLTLNATQANFNPTLALNYGSRSGPGQSQFLPYQMNSDWNALGVEAIVIDIAEFTASSNMRLWVHLISNARPHASIDHWVVSESAEVILQVQPAPGGTLLVIPKSQFVNLTTLPLDWSDIDGLNVGTLSQGHLSAGGRLVIRDIYAVVPEPASVGMAMSLAAVAGLRRRRCAA